MKYLLLSTILFSPLFGYSQEWKKTYYTSDGRETEESTSDYYILEKENWSGVDDTLKSYFTVGNVPRFFSVVNEKGEKDGPTVYYHRNGYVKYQARYKDGLLEGDVVSYYPDGKKQSVETFSLGAGRGPTDYWDSLGNQIVRNGSGFCRCVFRIPQWNGWIEVGKLVEGKKDSVWVGVDQSGRKLYEETFESAALVKGTSFDEDGTQYTYTEVEETAEFPGGMRLVYDHVGKVLMGKYPKEARKKGIEGKVFIQFVIEREGSVVDVRVLKGIGGGCDELALKAVKTLPRWIPGKQRGKPVRQKMVMPIIFKLS